MKIYVKDESMHHLNLDKNREMELIYPIKPFDVKSIRTIGKDGAQMYEINVLGKRIGILDGEFIVAEE